MRWSRVVIDTNVVVSGTITPIGNSARILDLALAGDLTILYDERILGEYDDVLRHPRFGLNPRDVTSFVEFIRAEGEFVPAKPLAISLPDPKDLPFLEVAVAGQAQALVTGNARHFRASLDAHCVNVVTPAEFLVPLNQTDDR
ncbi:MAG: putative toxin-antitoxin system toxin component, PIN family [Candidatus Schekmanbacteria bacterium]|nr:putative toxin-antitoxin system toxin component, PIN family [Candidatus Schekmanbacteria bacterium]